MSAFRFDTRLAAAALLALGLGAAAPDWAAAQGGGGQCQLWAKMETAVKAADLKAAIALEEEIDLEPRCSGKGLDAKKAVVEVYRALMAIADDRKVLTDQDVRSVIGRVRTDQTVSHDAVDPFDTPSAAQPAIHESGYGHGV